MEARYIENSINSKRKERTVSNSEMSIIDYFF